LTATADGGNIESETTADGGRGGEKMLQNLRGEMARRNVTACDIGRVIGKTDRTARDKIADRYPFTLTEAKIIRDTFFRGMDLEYLFAGCGEKEVG